MPGHDRTGVGPGKRRRAHQHLVEHTPQAVEVRRGAQRVTHRLFGAHVERRADRGAGLGQLFAGLGGGLGDPEVGDEGVATGEQDILWFDVAVDDVPFVGVPQGVGDLQRDMNRVVDRELGLAVEPVAQRFPFDERHDVVEQAVGLPGIVETEDVRVLELGGHANFTVESLGTDRGAELRVQHLDGDLALMLEILREVDGGHAAGAELAFHAIPVGQSRLQSIESVAHGSGWFRGRDCG